MDMIECEHCNTQMHQTSEACPSCGAPSPRAQDNSSNNLFFWYKTVFSKYAVFSGRARRKEYWMFVLASSIISLILLLISMIFFKLPLLNYIYNIVSLLPSFALCARRLHDTNHRGWWILVPIAGLVFMFFEGDYDSNRFGDNPKLKNNSQENG